MNEAMLNLMNLVKKKEDQEITDRVQRALDHSDEYEEELSTIKNTKSNIHTKTWFGFYCKYCNEPRKIDEEDFEKYELKNLGLVDGYYEKHVRCPVCRKHLVFREKGPLTP